MSTQEFLQEDDICRSLLHLSTAADHHSSAFTPTRHSSDSPSQLDEPLPKRPTLLPPSSPLDYHLLGFTKIQLPQPFPVNPSAPLRRTLSEPIYSPSAAPTHSPVMNQSRRRNLTQEPSLHRTPPRPRAGRNSPSCGESPSTKRLKRMRERLREMGEWWNQVVSEDGEEDDIDEPENDRCNNNNPKEDSENAENTSQEAVLVEKNGDNLVLHFRCPCNKGYEVLLSGTSCYYKLTSF